LHPHRAAAAGGTWGGLLASQAGSLLASQAGSLLFWISLFISSGQAALRAAAYGLWLVSLVLVLYDLWQSLRKIADRSDEQIELESHPEQYDETQPLTRQVLSE
jgi:hypothetical protein